MKRLLLHLTCLMTVSAGPFWAQTILGTWQGTLPVPEDPRVVLKISRGDDGSLRGAYFRIDRGPDGGPLSSVRFTAPELNITFGSGYISYRGELSADGQTLTGTWTQDQKTYHLSLARATPDTRWRPPSAAPAMAATADPAFEVATIKLTPPDVKQMSFGLRSPRFTATYSTVEDLIEFAYRVRPRQVEGGTSWMDETKFDIVAESNTPGSPSEDQDRLMLRKLLADRFQLKFHTVQRTVSVYELTMDNPARLTRTDPDVAAAGHGSIYTKAIDDHQTLVAFSAETMPDFIGILMNFIQDRQIVDQTGLQGMFDFTLTVPTSILQGGQASSLDVDPGSAFSRALPPVGFKLVPKKAPVPFLIIDHLERPSAN